jgi:hypothetical protein
MIMERIADTGAGFRSLTEAIDTTTAAGRMMMQMVAAFAEFERALLCLRPGAFVQRSPRDCPSHAVWQAEVGESATLSLRVRVGGPEEF